MLYIFNNKKINILLIKKIINLLSKEINISIFTHLNFELKYEFIKNCIISKKSYVYLCYKGKKLVGCAVLANNPSEYFNNSYLFKLKVLFYFLTRLKFKTLINIFLAFFKIDIILLNKSIKKIIKNNLNLNLIVVDKNYQSQGIGRSFFKKILNDLKDKKKKIITLETENPRSISFYKKKMNFKIVGKKIRISNNQTIMIKNF
tara:strand:+ start:200 stop:808 length:609 start_codon:yes stop_codon:yes gene_type:complete